MWLGCVSTFHDLEPRYSCYYRADVRLGGTNANARRGFGISGPSRPFRFRKALTELRQAASRTIPAPNDLQQIGLTAREGEVLHWVIQGKRDKEIADILSASPRTIHNHVRSILRKLNTETRTAAALAAFERFKGSPAS